MNNDDAGLTAIQDSWEEHRGRLAAVATLRIHSMLLQRITVQDVIQQTFLNALKRPDFFVQHPDVPVFSKLRMILMQTLKDFERQYLKCQKRDLFKEVSFEKDDSEQTRIQQHWSQFASSATSPLSRLAKEERNLLLHKILYDLSEADREILELRHFEQLSNAECAGVLGISPDASSIRYVRALRRMQKLLIAFSEFRV